MTHAATRARRAYPWRFDAASVLGMEDVPLPPLWVGLLRFMAKLAMILLAAWAVLWVLDWAEAKAAAAGNERLMLGVIASLLGAYTLLMAVPFMPGIEVGLGLLMARGAVIAPFVYLATVTGLSLAFLAGRFLPHRWLSGILIDLRLKRSADLVARVAPMSREERLAHLEARLPAWARGSLGPWRYVLLAVVLNLPGNAVLGGGGGIGFAAGFSRLFHPAATLLTIALAVAPVPLVVWFLGDVP